MPLRTGNRSLQAKVPGGVVAIGHAVAACRCAGEEVRKAIALNAEDTVADSITPLPREESIAVPAGGHCIEVKIRETPPLPLLEGSPPARRRTPR